MARKKKKSNEVYKTEAELIVEARAKQEEQRRLEALKKPTPVIFKKIENFWYHNKTPFVIALIGAMMVFVFISDIILTPKPDVRVVLMSSLFFEGENLDNLKHELEKYVPDVNGDNKKIIWIEQIPFGSMTDDDSSDEGYMYSMKLLTILSTDDDQVFILDSYNYKLMMSMEEKDIRSMFINLEAVEGSEDTALPLMSTKLKDAPEAHYYGDLAIYLRTLEASDWNAKKLAGNEAFLRNLVADDE